MSIPPKPERFDVLLPPPGVEARFVEFWRDRPLLPAPARSMFAHTMAASVATSLQSAWNHAHRAPGTNTCPTYAVGLDGAARKMLPSNRRSIATSTVAEYELAGDDPRNPWSTYAPSLRPKTNVGDISWWSLSIETADTGYLADPTISAFTSEQVETLAVIYAYEATVNEFPLTKLADWWGAGCGTHTEPFGYPYTTLYQGKFCPGSKKKAQFWAEVLPQANAVVAAWFPPPPSEDDDMPTAQEVVDAMKVDDELLTAIANKVWRTTLNTSDPSGNVGKFNIASVVGWSWNKLRGGA
jgi:hypothetical protein